ncbi:MAG: RagB/SusD family nutrient uptake outer membrane protein [Bacteroidales bacterium]|nr:RagB/SusD family nutrient uptake outer membrane protein [Bacteroidales bacterium]
MKNTIKHTLHIALIALLVASSGCSEFTDITPKGQSILDKVEDLDLLLNDDYGQLSSWESFYLLNDAVPPQNILEMVTRHETEGIHTVESVFVTWDENVDRTTLTQDPQQNLYAAFYGIIGKIANPILAQVDRASGSKAKADQIKAEALVLRAYFHYLAVNFYAKAYNPATAATDGGVPYMFEDFDMTELANKRTVQEVYNFILADLDAAFALNALPETPNRMRIGKAFAYALKAKVLMATRDYSGANQAATASLEIYNRLIDHRNQNVSIPMPPFDIQVFARPRFNDEDLFYMMTSFTGRFVYSPELLASFDPNDILINFGELEDNVYPILTGGMKMNQGGNMTSLAGVQAWFHYVMAGDFNVLYTINGLSTVDMLLTQAECKIRSNDISGAITILNQLRERRIIPSAYLPLPAGTNETDAIAALKKVSRCENFATVKNFINMKRWNATESQWQETLTKTLTLAVNGFMPIGGNPANGWMAIPPTTDKTYTLRPDSPLWVFPFPQYVTSFNPNITQNY